MQKEIPINRLAQQQLGGLNIQEKLRELTRLNQLWHTHVDIDLVKHTKIANFRDNRLIIAVANPMWITRLRYSIPDLFKKLRKEKEFADLERIEWYIEPSTENPLEKRRAPIKLTSSNALLLEETASGINNDKLKALQALAKNK